MMANEGGGAYTVYILSCADGAFYTGMMCDLARRLTEHRAGCGSKWVAQRLPVELVFVLDGLSYRSAWKIECYIKTQTCARKQALIDGDSGILALAEKRKVPQRG